MASAEYEKTAANLLGIPSRGPVANEANGLSSNNQAPTTAWEIYNQRAAIFDRELIKDWNASLNTLLVFAALYSAILTAFIIVSMELLQEDPAEVTRDALLTITKQLANQSIAAYERPSFEAPSHALRVNVFFFMSIILSLIAALGAVLALQWVSNYDFGLNPSSPKDRALQRHFRFVGIEEWKMAEIIGFLPIFLFLSLFLFLIGLADWLFHIHKAVAAVVVLGLAIASVFYITTTSIAIRYTDAPFRTSVSKSIPFFYHKSIAYIKVLISLLLGRKHDGTKGLEADHSFAKREASALHRKSLLEVDTLLWAVSSIDILPHSRNIFKNLLEGFMELPTEHLLQPKIRSAPWVSVFTLLCEPYLGRRGREDYSDEEIKSNDLSFLLRSIAMVGNIQTDEAASKEIFSSLIVPFASRLQHWTHDALSAYAEIALMKSGYSNDYFNYKSYTDDTIAHLHTLPEAFSRLSLKILHNTQSRDIEVFRKRFSPKSIQHSIAKYCNIDSGAMMNTPLLSYELLHSLLRLLATDLSGHSMSVDVPLKAYLYAYEEAQRDGRLDIAHQDAHQAIRRQYIFRLTQITWGIDPLLESNQILNSIYDLISLTSGEARVTTVRDLFLVIFSKTFRSKWSVMNRQHRLNIVVSAFGHPVINESYGYDFDAFLRHRRILAIACEKVLNDDIYTISDRIFFIRLYCGALEGVQFSDPDFGNWADSIGNPALLLGIWAIYRLKGEFSGLSFFPSELWKDPVWSKAIEWAFNHSRVDLENLQYPKFIALARNALIHGSPRTKRRCVKMLAHMYGYNWTRGKNVEDLDSIPKDGFELFEEPVLCEIFHMSDRSLAPDTLKFLRWGLLFPRFAAEFAHQGGFGWLEHEIEATGGHFRYIDVIVRGMHHAKTFSELVQWASCLRESLCRQIGNSLANTIEDIGRGGEEDDDDDDDRYWYNPRYAIKDEIDRIGTVELILENQSRKRSSNDTAQPKDEEYGYVKEWDESQWDDWRGYMEGLIEGLKSGRIIDNSPNYVRDPDGACFFRI